MELQILRDNTFDVSIMCVYQKLIAALYILLLCNYSISEEQSLFTVCITTIPPRFKSIHHSLLSWFDNDTGPHQLFIFIPKKYRRFRLRKKQSTNHNIQQPMRSHAENLRSILLENEVISGLLWQKKIDIIELEKDWGPISKFLGAMQVLDRLHDYVIFCDDDVMYSPRILDLYSNASKITPYLFDTDFNFGWTLFAETYRLVLPTFGKQSELTTSIQHVQGVDSYAVQCKSFSNERGSLCFNRAVQVVEKIHELCPQSFYQDDYIASFLLHVGNVHMISVRNHIKSSLGFVRNIEGVSKNNFQMHMQDDVFVRELATQQCIMGNAEMIYLSIIEPNKFIINNSDF